jgi:hypothetical protein
MLILFLHGWQSTPGGVKPTYLKDHGHTVLNPSLPDDDFDAAVRIAQAEFDRHWPHVIVGSSRGGAVAMNIDSREKRPLVLLCPSWKQWGTAKTVIPGTVILHSRADAVVPFADSEELLRNSGLTLESLIEVGSDHRLADFESLETMLKVVERATQCNEAQPNETKSEMGESLPIWQRRYYARPGGRPCLFYVVYGKFESQPSLSRSYRTAGVPAGFELLHYDSETHPEVLTRFQEGYLWDKLQARNMKLAARIAESRECMILRGEIEDCENLNYLRDSVGLLTYFLDHGGVAIYDPLMFEWWEPDNWHKWVFEPAGPVPNHHVVTLASEESDADLNWLHTRGMRKFGRPDLSIHNVPFAHQAAIIDLFGRFVEFQAFGGIIEEGREIRMHSLPEGMTCHHGGDLDDPDFNNCHVEIKY